MIEFFLKFLQAVWWHIKRLYPLKKWENVLLKHHPEIWRLRIVPIFYWSIVASLFAFAMSLIAPSSGKLVYYFSNTALFIFVSALIYWSTKLDQFPTDVKSKSLLLRSAVIYTAGIVLISFPAMIFVGVESQNSQGSSKAELAEITKKNTELERWSVIFEKQVFCSRDELIQNSEEKFEMEISGERYALAFFEHEKCKKSWKSLLDLEDPEPTADEQWNYCNDVYKSKKQSEGTCAIFIDNEARELIDDLKLAYDLGFVIPFDEIVENARTKQYEASLSTGKIYKDLAIKRNFIIAFAIGIRFLMLLLKKSQQRYGHLWTKERRNTYIRSSLDWLAPKKVHNYFFRKSPFLWAMRVPTLFVFAMLCGLAWVLDQNTDTTFLLISILVMLLYFVVYLTSYFELQAVEGKHLSLFNTFVVITYLPSVLVIFFLGDNGIYFHAVFLCIIYIFYPVQLFRLSGFFEMTILFGIYLILLMWFGEYFDILVYALLGFLHSLFLWVTYLRKTNLNKFCLMHMLVVLCGTFIVWSFVIYDELYPSRELIDNTVLFTGYILGLLLVINVLYRPLFSQLEHWLADPE